MKTKITKLFILFLVIQFITLQQTFSQESVISGKVMDESGMPVLGVTVLIEGTKTGTQTDFDGNYSIKASIGKILIFSYLGMKSEKKLIQNSSLINVTMQEDEESLDEIVVTAMGIERAEKTLGYAVSTVKSADFEEARETDVVQALQGKISGVQITGQGGGVGSSTKITIRGLTRISGNNQPLWVVDGVPISDANDFSDSRTTGSIDYGNRAQDINPDDIESLTVLKGASAAALYGSRASNGVIVVTTKKGKGDGKATITYSSTIRFDSPLLLPDFQNTYGPGNQGIYNEDDGDTVQSASKGWGPAISSGTPYTDLAGNAQTFQANPDIQKDFYNLGSTVSHNFAVSGASNDGKNDYRLSSSHTSVKGILPGSLLNKLNLGLNSGSQLSNKLKSRFSINYINTGIEGAVSKGVNDPNVLTSIINRLPRITNIEVLKPWIADDGITQLSPIDEDTNNPYWIVNENHRTSDTERFFGNVSFDYNPVEHLTMLGRVGYDSYNTKHFRSNHVGTLGYLDGNYKDNYISRKQLTLDYLATYDNSFGNFDVTLMAGVQWNEREYEQNGNLGTSLSIPELFSPGNVASNSPTKNYSLKQIFGAFGDFTMTYKKWLTLNATARNDWSSTLPVNGNSYFYPSVALSFVFSDAFNIDKSILSYGKLRTNWANVGGDTTPYQLDYLYYPQTSYYGQFNTAGTFPFNGQIAYSGPNSLPNADLKPENQLNKEIGVELGFFKNRIKIDATYYKNTTTDQIIPLSTPASTGYSTAWTNLGEISNTGFELELGLKVIRSEKFKWNLDANFSTNETIIEDLGDLEQYTLASSFGGLVVAAEEGKSIGLYGNRFARAVDGDGNTIEDQILVNSNGLRFEGDNGRLGNITPDFTMGLTSVFSYKGWRLSTTFDWKQGGILYSQTVGTLRTSGLAAETATDRETLFVDPNTFVDNGDGTYSENTIAIPSVQQYWNSYSSSTIHESNTFDATYIKWRELGLSYSFNKKQLQNIPFTALSLSLQGRNLAIFNTSIPHIDPETNLFGSSSNGGGIEYNGLPSTSSIGLSVKVKF